MISYEYAEKVYNCYIELKEDITLTALRFNLPISTIERYLRQYKKIKPHYVKSELELTEKEVSNQIVDVNKKVGKEIWIIASDFHVPFHNQILFDKFAQYIYNTKPHGIIINGDFLDMFSISKYAKNSLFQLKHITLGKEYEQGCYVLAQLDRILPAGTKKVFIMGNHENRFYTWIQEADNAKLEGATLDPIAGLKLRERGYEVVSEYPDGKYLLGSHLEVVHGYYANIHVSKKTVEKLNTSVLFGHTHRYQIYSTGLQAGFNIGCMCDIYSDGFKYMPRPNKNDWLNAFAEAYIDSNGFFYVQPIQAYNNSFFAGGKLY